MPQNDALLDVISEKEDVFDEIRSFGMKNLFRRGRLLSRMNSKDWCLIGNASNKLYVFSKKY